MAKPPGTPSSTGLIHMPQLATPAGTEYLQVGGFGPVSREEALNAAKQAGLVGRSKPSKIWVQRPRDDDQLDTVLKAVIATLDAARTRYQTIFKEPEGAAGFGVYYLYDDKVVMEHTSDPESVVMRNGKQVRLPHVHVEVIDYATLANSALPMNDRVKAINNFKIFDDRGYSPTATRLVRLGAADPSSNETKPKFNHHIYYNFPP